MYKMFRQFCVLILLAVAASGCVTQKQLTYLCNADASKMDSINAKFTPRMEHVIRPGDALTVFVSALDKEAVAPYNLPSLVYAVPGSNSVQTTPMLQYYMVDQAGEIELPVLGKVHVGGLSRPEAEQVIREKLENQIIDPTVLVSLVGAKVSVLGEVNRPSQVPMTSGRMTIFEALAAAGDMTPYGRRDNVLLTREVDGKLQIARLNLGDADIYTSPYYFLQQNDVVYVSPNKVRAISSTNSGLWLSVVSTALSAATIIVTVVKK